MDEEKRYVKVKDEFVTIKDKTIHLRYQADIAEMFPNVSWADVTEFQFQVNDRVVIASRCYLCWLIKRDTNISYANLGKLIGKSTAYARLATLSWPYYRTAIEDGAPLDPLYLVGKLALRKLAESKANQPQKRP